MPNDPQRQGNKSLLQAKSKFLLLHSPTHHVHSLTQILSSPEVRRSLLFSKTLRASRA